MDTPENPTPTPRPGGEPLLPLERQALWSACRLAVLEARHKMMGRIQQGASVASLRDDAMPTAQRVTETLLNVLVHIPLDRAYTAAAVAGTILIFEMLEGDIDGFAQLRAADAARQAADAEPGS